MAKLKVFLICNDDMTTNLIFHGLFGLPQVEVVGLGITQTLSKNKGGWTGIIEVLKRTDFRYWLFLIFTNGFFRLNRYISVHLGSRRSGHKHLLNLARAAGVPVYYSGDFNSPEFIQYLKSLSVELLLIRVNQILSAELLQIPRIDTWCVHSSLLPSYKGIAGEFHALNHCEVEIGSTIFRVSSKLDEGKSLAQTSFLVETHRSLFYHLIRNNLSASELVLKRVAELSETREIKFESIDARPSSYYSWPKNHEVAHFLKSRRLIGITEAIGFVSKCLFPTGL